MRRVGLNSPEGPTPSRAGQSQGLSLPTTLRVHDADGSIKSDRVNAEDRAPLMPVALESRRFRGWHKGTATKSKPSSMTWGQERSSCDQSTKEIMLFAEAVIRLVKKMA